MSHFLRERLATKNGEAIALSPVGENMTNPWYGEGSSPPKVNEGTVFMHALVYSLSDQK